MLRKGYRMKSTLNLLLLLFGVLLANFAYAESPREQLQQMAQLKIKPQKPAAPQGPIVPADVWKKVLDTALSYGTLEVDGKTWQASYSLADTVGDPKADNVMHGIYVVGDYNSQVDGLMDMWGVQLAVIESKFVPAAGLWRIDTWIFRTNASGQLKEAFFNTVMVATDAVAGEGTTTPSDLAAPKTKARYDEMLKYWAERKP